MKQKVVIKVSMAEQKCRKRAFKIVVSQTGVESAALKGENGDQIEVVGDGMDAAVLTTLLRKKVGYAELMSVGPAGDKKDGDGKKDGNDQKKNETPALPQPVTLSCYPYYGFPQYPIYEARYPCHDPSCTIM